MPQSYLEGGTKLLWEAEGGIYLGGKGIKKGVGSGLGGEEAKYRGSGY
jgi:hypothetical protein